MSGDDDAVAGVEVAHDREDNRRGMKSRNWPLWTGLVVTLVAFFSYLFVFTRFPITRDIPWANYILFALAMTLLAIGIRRARKKIVAGIVMAVGVAIFVFFVAVVTIASKNLPPSLHAPRVGQKAPDFALLDTNHHTVTLDQLIASTPRGVLLIFYRGYW